ncbi:hypothetical protein TIFTF001_042812 [Ficus carica]|uniref:Uncharacterized protein n=1 Tax=Ficus carica TaxID=3494 RepID=A0AA87YU73_FICCA|nr:hypothetical protein TIFTF001_042812 [Ficus carica]
MERVEGVGRDCFGAEHGELVAVRHHQIRAHPPRWLVNTTKAGLQGGGKGVGLVHGPALLIVGGVFPSRAANFFSLLLAFFLRWSDCTDGCSSVDRRGFAEWDRFDFLRVGGSLAYCPIGLWTLGPFGGSLTVLELAD